MLCIITMINSCKFSFSQANNRLRSVYIYFFLCVSIEYNILFLCQTVWLCQLPLNIAHIIVQLKTYRNAYRNALHNCAYYLIKSTIYFWYPLLPLFKIVKTVFSYAVFYLLYLLKLCLAIIVEAGMLLSLGLSLLVFIHYIFLKIPLNGKDITH